MPHSMKKITLSILSLIALVAMTLSSCDTGSKSTPVFYGASKIIRTTSAGLCDTVLITDTFALGDTLRWNVVADGGFNALISFIASCDTNALALSFDSESVDPSVFIQPTDLDHAQIYFRTGEIFLWGGWLRIIPRKTGKHDISLTIANDSGADYSPRTWTYSPVIR